MRHLHVFTAEHLACNLSILDSGGTIPSEMKCCSTHSSDIQLKFTGCGFVDIIYAKVKLSQALKVAQAKKPSKPVAADY